MDVYARRALVVLAVIAVVFLLHWGAPFFIPLFVALLLAYALSPVADLVTRFVRFRILSATFVALAGAIADCRPDDLPPHAHPGRSATVWREGRRIGWVGHLHPRLLRALDLESGDVLWEQETSGPVSGGAVVHRDDLFAVAGIREPGQEIRMPVVYYVDPKIMDDPQASMISEITLSYTFYPVDSADERS